MTDDPQGFETGPDEDLRGLEERLERLPVAPLAAGSWTRLETRLITGESARAVARRATRVAAALAAAVVMLAIPCNHWIASRLPQHSGPWPAESPLMNARAGVLDGRPDRVDERRRSLAEHLSENPSEQESRRVRSDR